MNNKHFTQIKPMSQPVALSIALLLTLCSAIAPKAHADEPPPFNKVCEEEYRGEAVRYVSDPDTNGFSRRHADVCFTEDKTTLFVEFKDYKPNLNSCSWRTTLNKQGDGYYKKTDECEIKMKLKSGHIIIENTVHFSAHYNDKNNQSETLKLINSPPIFNILQGKNNCSNFIPYFKEHFTEKKTLTLKQNENLHKLFIDKKQGSKTIFKLIDLDNDNRVELITEKHLFNSHEEFQSSIQILLSIPQKKSEEIKSHRYSWFEDKTISEEIHKKYKFDSYGEVLDLDNLLPNGLTLLSSDEGVLEKFLDYSIKIFSLERKNYLLIHNYLTEEKKKNEINIIEITSINKQDYKNLCNVAISGDYKFKIR